MVKLEPADRWRGGLLLLLRLFILKFGKQILIPIGRSLSCAIHYDGDEIIIMIVVQTGMLNDMHSAS